MGLQRTFRFSGFRGARLCAVWSVVFFVFRAERSRTDRDIFLYVKR